MKNTENLYAQKDEMQRILRFVFWGCLNTASSFAVYCAFVFIGTHIYVASFLSLVFGIFLGHFLNKHNVFRSTQKGTLYKYATVWLFMYVINIVLLWFFVQAGFNNYISGGIAGLLLVPISFMFQKIFVFR